MTVNDAAYSPDAFVHAVRYLDAAEDILDDNKADATINALLGIGWAILAQTATLRKTKK